MDGTIKVRFPNELWWDELLLKNILDEELIVSYLGDKTCFIRVNGQTMEISREDYDKILDKKLIGLKFELKKHNPFGITETPPEAPTDDRLLGGCWGYTA